MPCERRSLARQGSTTVNIEDLAGRFVPTVATCLQRPLTAKLLPQRTVNQHLPQAAGDIKHVLRVDQHGGVRTGATPGEAAITINYMGHVGVVRVIVPLPNAASRQLQISSKNRIDAFVLAKLQMMGISPSPLSEDAMFLRRLYLDTIGMLPTPREMRLFLADDDAQKRQRAIEEVLCRPELARLLRCYHCS